MIMASSSLFLLRRQLLLRQCALLRPISTAGSNNCHSMIDKSTLFYDYNQSSARRSFCAAASRRKRQSLGSTRYRDVDEEAGAKPDVGGLSEPFQHDQADVDQYLQKASLSPFVPVPDPVARKMLELADAGPDDIHVELGSGDGRVCFHAIDPPFGVKQSIGVDIDKKLISISNERLNKRHPKPDNIEFTTMDLVDSRAPIWKEIGDNDAPVVVTMYFVEDALRKIRPYLELALRENKECRIVTCGYAMPGWEPQVVETILGLQVCLYQWGRNNKTPSSPPQPSLTPEERAQAMAEPRPVVEQPLDEIQPTNNGLEDAEKIEVSFYDETEEIDFHWDDFDEPIDEDPDDNPEIEKWRNPE